MDSLSDKERIEAWKSAWRVSLDGWAIVDKEFNFQAINPQWLELMGVLPSEFIGKSFEDITPIEVRRADTENAKLVIEGKINSYLIHKSYRFSDGTEKKIVLLVTRVPFNPELPFQFFLSRVLIDEASINNAENELLKLKLSHPPILEKVINFIMKYWAWIISVAAAITGIVIEVMKVL